MKSQTKTRSKIRYAIALFVVVGASLLAGVGCASMSKETLAQELASLGKNQVVGSLQRREMTVDLGDGPETVELVYYSVSGPAESSADPVFLVHSTPSSLYSWSELIHGAEGFEGMAATRDVHAIEVLGHGIAPASEATLTFERCARYVSAAVRALGLERVHLVGNSYGGEFAWRAALNDPDVFESLVLMDSSGYQRREGDWLPEEIEMRENSLATIGWLINSQERIEKALKPHFDEVPPDRAEEFFLVCENSSNWRGMVELARDENGTRQSEIASIETPTLVLWGEDDVAYSLDYYGKRFANDITGSKLKVLPDTGHYPHEQHPEAVVPALEEFFRSVEAEQ